MQDINVFRTKHTSGNTGLIRHDDHEPARLVEAPDDLFGPWNPSNIVISANVPVVDIYGSVSVKEKAGPFFHCSLSGMCGGLIRIFGERVYRAYNVVKRRRARWFIDKAVVLFQDVEPEARNSGLEVAGESRPRSRGIFFKRLPAQLPRRLRQGKRRFEPFCLCPKTG